jgi:hypothetical protein
MSAKVWRQATAETQARTVTLATSNSKDDTNIKTAHNSRNGNSWKESYNRAINTIWTPAKAEMLAKLPATACTEASYTRDTVKLEMTAAAVTIRTSWMSSAVGPPEQTVGTSDSRQTEDRRPATARMSEIVETRGNSSQIWVENTNMTDCIFSLETAAKSLSRSIFLDDDILLWCLFR